MAMFYIFPLFFQTIRVVKQLLNKATFTCSVKQLFF